MNQLDWLPKKIIRDDDLKRNAYSIFLKDFKRNDIWLDGKKVIINKDDQITFKHLTTQGQESNREHCNLRCERIPWIKAIIANAKNNRVKRWVERINGIDVHYLALEDFSYLVVLKSRNDTTIGLATAYCIDSDYEQDLKSRYEKYINKSGKQNFKKPKRTESLDDIYEHFLQFERKQDK